MAIVHQCPVPRASLDAVAQAVVNGASTHPDSAASGAFDAAAAAPQPITDSRSQDLIAPDYVGFERYLAQGGYALAQAVSAGDHDPQALIATMEDSGLRGLGGAGFPAGRKWRIVREQAGPRLMAINIDEGEPGTFKDRTYLERDPHRFLEGMLIAAMTVGIEACYLYLRDEYHGCRAILQNEIARLQADPPCPLPRIELRRGAGAYICGEESAMIESIEGKRGEPRMRPPYIAEVGLFGRPTLEHNFETLFWVRDILQRGAAWFSGFGRHGRRGLRSFSVSGRVREPGVKLAPAGITARELIDEYCGGMLEGHTLGAYLPGGASGGILPARMADIPLDFDTLQPHGCFIGSAAVIVLSQHDRARDAALNMMRFFADESCGQCTPCRVGTAKAVLLMQAAGRLKALRDRHGPKSLAGFGSAKGSNEEAYLFQKLVRTGFGSNNVDHCTRLCHASSVAALLEGVGSGAVSNHVNDVEHAELIFVIGSNPTANHPVAATWMKNAAKRGAKIVLADPRITDIGKHAWRTLPFNADTDVAMLNALIHVVIDEGLVDQASLPSAPATSRPCARRSGPAAPRRWRRSAAFRPTRCAKWPALLLPPAAR